MPAHAWVAGIATAKLQAAGVDRLPSRHELVSTFSLFHCACIPEVQLPQDLHFSHSKFIQGNFLLMHLDACCQQ